MIGPRANSSSCTQMTPKRMSPALTFLLSSRLRDPVACFSSSLGCLVASGADRVKLELLTSHSFFSCSCLTLPRLSKWVHCPPDCPDPKARGVAVSSLSSLHSPRALRPEACQPHPQGPTAATWLSLLSAAFFLHDRCLSLGLLQQPPAALWMPRIDSLHSGQRIF